MRYMLLPLKGIAFIFQFSHIPEYSYSENHTATQPHNPPEQRLAAIHIHYVANYWKAGQ